MQQFSEFESSGSMKLISSQGCFPCIYYIFFFSNTYRHFNDITYDYLRRCSSPYIAAYVVNKLLALRAVSRHCYHVTKIGRCTSSVAKFTRFTKIKCNIVSSVGLRKNPPFMTV